VVETIPSIPMPKMGEMVAGSLRSQIAHGTLVKGDALPSEKELMERFGISRPTLREAIRILESEGLLRIHRGARGGAIVTTPHVSAAARQVGLLLQLEDTSMADVYVARTLIEVSAAATLARNRKRADVDALRAQIDLTRLVADDPVKYAQAAGDFHLMLVERSGNQTLALIARLFAELTVDTYLRAVRLPPRFKAAINKSIRSYDALVDYIEAGDAAKAEAHWRKHMDEIATGPAVSDPSVKVDVDRLAELARVRREAGLAIEAISKRRVNAE
jgi:GntR family transcriptional regulator, transcriptional repressor for pyruvate dehydrogenase complex